jgi:hypothetical protein
MEKVQTFTPARAAAVAAGFAAVKPKNLLLTVAAAAAIAETGGGAARQAGAMAFFVVLASVGVAAPVAIHLFMKDLAPAILSSMREWMVRESQTIVAIVWLSWQPSSSAMGSAASPASAGVASADGVSHCSEALGPPVGTRGAFP